jgi:hypothetical protein
MPSTPFPPFDAAPAFESSPMAPTPVVPRSPMPPAILSPRANAPLPTDTRAGVPMPSQNVPDFARQMIPVALSALMGGNNPHATAAGMAGMLRGRELRRKQAEDEQTTASRRQLEAAKFYSDVLHAANNYDDEDQLQRELSALAPIAQHYGIDLRSIHVADSKKVEKAKKEAQATVEQLRKVYGADVDNPEWRKGKSINGRSVDDLFAAAQTPVPMQNGQAVAPTPKSDKPLNPRALQAKNIVVNGKRITANFDPDDGKYYDQEGKVIPNALLYDDEPGNGRGGPSDMQRFSMTERLAGGWTKANAPVKEMDRQLRIMRSGMTGYDTDPNGASQSILVTFQKILDPTSVVRESEYARTTEGQAILDRLKGRVERALKGGTTLTKAELHALVGTAESIFKTMADWNAGTRRRIEAQAKQNGIDPALVFDDVLVGGSSAPSAAPSTGAATPGRKRYDMNGNRIP